MNKNILVIAVVVVSLIISAFLVYSIVTHVKPPEPKLAVVETKAAAPAVTSGESESSYFSAAENYEKAGDLVKAKESYQ